MKIAITGHTSGFGKTVYDRCSHLQVACVGFSRTNGYDITDAHARRQIVHMSQDCDVFINNAYDGYGQIDMLYDIYHAWHAQPKHIVTIGSYASNAAEWRLQPCKYSAVKRTLDTVTYQLVNSHNRAGCRLSILKPGYMGNGHPLSFESVGDRLIDLINQKQEIIEVVIL